MDRIKKTSKLGPGTHEVEKAITKTQEISKSFMFRKQARKTFVELYVDNKKNNPGIGKYKETDKGYNALSRPVSSLRRRR